MSGQSVRAVTVDPTFFASQPATAGEIIGRLMERQPADLWLVCLGTGDAAARVMDRLFMHGPAEPDVIDGKAEDEA